MQFCDCDVLVGPFLTIPGITDITLLSLLGSRSFSALLMDCSKASTLELTTLTNP